MKMLIEKTHSAINRMRWRAHHYLKKGEEEDHRTDENNYGFKSRKSPPHVVELEAFEDDLAKIIESIAFRRTRDKFQDRLQRDITRINRSKSVFVQADKTRNLYEVSPEQHSKLLKENITKHYRLAENGDYEDTNMEARDVAEKLRPKLSTRMEPMAKREA